VCVWKVKIVRLDAKQQLLHLPLPASAAIPFTYVSEYKQLSPNSLLLSFVDPNTPARAKRYKVVRHHGGVWTSIPGTWLRDRSAKDGDAVLVTQPTPDTFLLELERQP
jgi:hypothetical protein